ncbi:MAG: hypothetical protein QOC97_745 [Chloroflexota bacterium]|jgi:hypothetical protein|nr:hypothetical protein [Chloroflexota bacterium]
MQIAEDAMAGPDDGHGLTFDKLPIGIPVAGEDGIDDRSLITEVIGAWGVNGTKDGRTPTVRSRVQT